MSKLQNYKFFCDKLSSWRAFGVSFNWDDGHYVGIYLFKIFVGIHKPHIKQAMVKTEDLRKDL
jgi:hypothetical protein